MCAARNWPSASFMNTSNRRILSRLSLLTNLSRGLVKRLSTKSFKQKEILSETGIMRNKRKIQAKLCRFTTKPPPGVPSSVGQGRPSCHFPEKIKKSSFSPLFDVRRHWINLTLGYLDLR